MLEKAKENRIKFYEESVTVLWTLANYQEARVKLITTQLNKLKSTAKTKKKKKSKNKESINQKRLREIIAAWIFLATRQTTEIIYDFANNMSTDKKLRKVLISKIIQSAGTFGSWLAE